MCKLTPSEKAAILTTELAKLIGHDRLRVVWKEEYVWYPNLISKQIIPASFQIRGPSELESNKPDVPWVNFGTIKSSVSYLRKWLIKWTKDYKRRRED